METERLARHRSRLQLLRSVLLCRDEHARPRVARGRLGELLGTSQGAVKWRPHTERRKRTRDASGVHEGNDRECVFALNVAGYVDLRAA